MAAASGVADTASASTPAWRARAGATVPYLLMALVVGFVVQGYLAGAGFMVGGEGGLTYFSAHKSLVHVLELLVVLLAVAGFLGRDKTAGWVGVLLFALISAQYAFIQMDAGTVRALHVGNAFIILGSTVALLVRRWPWKAFVA